MKIKYLLTLLSVTFGTAYAATPIVNTIKEQPPLQTTLLNVVDTSAPTQMNISISNIPTSLKDYIISDLDNVVAKQNQNVKVNIIENKFTTTEVLEAVQLGVIDLAVVSTNDIYNVLKIKDIQLFNLPFLFSSSEDFKKVVNGSPGRLILNEINENSSLFALGFVNTGVKNILGFESYNNVNSFNGKKIGTTSLGINNDKFSFLGSQAYKLNLNEMPMYLNSNPPFLNGVEISLEGINENLLNSTAKSITELKSEYNTAVIIVNKKWFSNINKNLATSLINETKKWSDNSAKIIESEQEKIKESLSKNNFTFHNLTDNERDSFKKAVVPVHSLFLSKINKELLLDAYKTIRE